VSGCPRVGHPARGTLPAMAVGRPRRWDLTAEERTRLERAHERSLTGGDILRLLVSSPGLARALAPEVARVVSDAARGLPKGDMAIASLIRGIYDRQLIPDAGLGVGYLDYEQVLDGVRRFVDPQTRALELGCRGGRVSVRVAPFVGELVATDISKAMLAEAGKALAEHPNAVCRPTDGFTLREFADGSFDLVFAVGVMTFLTPNHLLGMLVEIARVLRAGGVWVANYMVLDDPEIARRHVDRVLEDARARRPRGGVEQAYTLESLGALYRIAGLEVLGPPPGEQPPHGTWRVAVVGRA
jgi:SAM-dependent methyltransferase